MDKIQKFSKITKLKTEKPNEINSQAATRGVL